jgi:ArsR family transcriptional regulator, arsenate/arsenite/antimonite-responsive transcriptional repressor / arsenate reductase (thioredoxin)
MDALESLKLLADDTRWRLVAALRYGDLQVGELVQRLSLSQNLVSYHLGILRQAGVVQVHRSDADARVSYYALDLTALKALYARIGAELQIAEERAPLSPGRAPTVVFLCTANSARSQIAEGWLRHLSGGRAVALSAGTQPQALHPLAAQAMQEVGVEIGQQRAKPVADLLDTRPDLIVTVCDIAREGYSPWAATPHQLHWSIPDPLRDPAIASFRSVRDTLRIRVEGLLSMLSGIRA